MLKLCRQPYKVFIKALSKALGLTKPLKPIEKPQNGPLKQPELCATLQPEPQKVYANSTQEDYDPTKYQPAGVSLAPVRRSMSPLRYVVPAIDCKHKQPLSAQPLPLVQTTSISLIKLS